MPLEVPCAAGPLLAGSAAAIWSSSGQRRWFNAARHFLSEPFIEEFRAKLVGDVDEQLRAARVELARLEGAQERISRLIAADESEDPVLLARYSEARDRAQTQRIHVNELVAGTAAVDREAIAAQIDVVDPLRVLDDLFDSDIPAAQVRAVLSRLFPSVVLERKLSTYQSVFSVRFSPGVALAMLSGARTIEEHEIELRFLLRYWPVHNLGEARWTVAFLTPERPEALRQPFPIPEVAHSGVAL